MGFVLQEDDGGAFQSMLKETDQHWIQVQYKVKSPPIIIPQPKNSFNEQMLKDLSVMMPGKRPKDIKEWFGKMEKKTFEDETQPIEHLDSLNERTEFSIRLMKKSNKQALIFTCLASDNEIDIQKVIVAKDLRFTSEWHRFE